MAQVSGTEDVVNVEVGGVVGRVAATKLSKWYLWRKDGKALFSYLLDSEVHTFAFSVAANSILSFIPFIVLLYTISLSVFHSQQMAGVVNDMVNLFMPSNQDLIVCQYNIEASASRRSPPRRRSPQPGHDSYQLAREFFLPCLRWYAQLPGMGRSQEPQLSPQPTSRLRSRYRNGRPWTSLHSHQHD